MTTPTQASVEAKIAAMPPSRVIPTVQGLPYYTMRTRLEGRDFVLGFNWNEREARWTMNIFADDGTPLVQGVKLICNWPILRFYHHDTRLPPGEMMAIALATDDAPPGFFDFGIEKRVVLTYFPLTDV